MKVLIIYDSMYGNTEKVALSMAKAFNPSEVKVLSVEKAKLYDLQGINLLIIGSPTHGGRPKQSLQTFLKQIPANSLKGISVASFDTRFLEQDQNFALRLLMKTIGYAAPKIAKVLKSKGGKLVVPPEGFIVIKKEGPLKNGELERATSWAKNMLTL